MKKRLLIASHCFALWATIFSGMPALKAQDCLPGGITFTTQAEIDAFPTNYPGCTHIVGNVTINDGDNNADITNLNGLSNLISIGGSLVISSGCDGLPDLNGLNNLATIGVDLTIFDCDAMINLSGLNSLTTIGRRLQISASDALVNLTGLDNLLSTGDYFYVHNNDALTSLSGLGSLDSVGGYLDISSHNLLSSLNGLGPLTTIGTHLYLSNSPNLSACNTSGICDYLADAANPASISNNALGCNTRIEVEATCVNPFCPPSLVLSSQADVDAFAVNYPNCTMISGNVTINDGDNNADITNLNGLSNLISIGGSLVISSGCDGLPNLEGLNNLATIGVDLTIFDCDAMINLSGLNSLTTIGRRLQISASDALVNLTGLDNLLSTGDYFYVHSNDALTSLSGLGSLDSVGGYLDISSHNLLSSLNGLGPLTTIGTHLYLSNSPNLSACNISGICNYLADAANPASINNNALGCNTRIEVEAACDASPEIRYVRQGGSGTGDGSSWANASADLRAMLDASSTGDEVWVATGTYKPTTGTDASISFVLNKNVAIYGGFPASGDPGMSDRDWTAYPTILSGDIGTPNDMSDNTRNVLKIFNVGNGAIVDGFTIRDGAAHAIENGIASPTLTNCSFLNNNVGIFLGVGSPVLTNCVFADNKLPDSGFGSGIVSFSGSMTLNNCVFNNNVGNALGIISGAWFALNNCTIANNGGVTNGSAKGVTMTNCIIWGNENADLPSPGVVATHSIVQGGHPGTGNIDEDPLFADADNRDFRLQACSPAIDAGTADGAPAHDFDWNPRPAGIGFDLGAYESQGTSSPVVANCLNPSVVLDPANTAVLSAAVLDDGSTGCGTLDLTVDGNSSSSFGCSDIGQNILTLTVTDARGHTATCLATVTVVDQTPPTITCPNPATVTCSSNVPAVNLAAVTAADNCGTPTKTHLGDATSNQTCANRKTVTRTYRATDGSGNSVTCSQVITVFDNVAPNFTSVPANVTVQCNSVPAVGSPAATDGCGGSVSIAYNGQTIVAGACPDAYTLIRQWTATDLCGNTRTATQRITVVDTQKPAFVSTPANITVQCDAIPDPATPTATDNCATVVAITYNGQTTANGSCPNAYTLTRRWTAADNCGNTVSVSQRITVVDNGKPVFTSFPENTTIACNDPIPPVGTPTATDGCGSATVTYLGQTTANSQCPGTYQLRRTWRATDACGNSTLATQTIQVSDNTAPVFTSVPANVTVSCNTPLPSLQNPTATDACGGFVSITFLGNVPTGSGCAQDYTVTRTWRAQDLCGNTALATQVITVQGNSYGEPEPEALDHSRPMETRMTQIDRGLTQINQPEGKSAEIRVSSASSAFPSAALGIQPNPTTDRIWLDLTDFADQTITVSIFSELGQLVWENRIPAVEDLKLQVSLREAGAKAGMYTVSVRSASGVVAKRVVLVE